MPLRARETFFVGRTMVSEGQLVADDDPILTGRAKLFEAVDKFGQPVVPDRIEHVAPSESITALRERARSAGVARVGSKSRERLLEDIAAAQAGGPTDDEGDEPSTDEETL